MKRYSEFIAEAHKFPHSREHTPEITGGKHVTLDPHHIVGTEASEHHYDTDPGAKKRVDGMRHALKNGHRFHPIAVRRIPQKDKKKGSYAGVKLEPHHTHAILDGHHRWMAHKHENKPIGAVENPRKVE